MLTSTLLNLSSYFTNSYAILFTKTPSNEKKLQYTPIEFCLLQKSISGRDKQINFVKRNTIIRRKPNDVRIQIRHLKTNLFYFGESVKIRRRKKGRPTLYLPINHAKKTRSL